MVAEDTVAIGVAEVPSIAEAESDPDSYSTPPGLFDAAPSTVATEQPAATPDPADAAVHAVAQQSDDESTEAGHEDRQNA
jgi:hypothetical protein